MLPLQRRTFLKTAAALPAATLTQPPAAARPGLWIDPKLAALPARRWRKIHLDFHNTPHIKKIGARFNADEFGDQLVAASVDSIVVFAKDMHGYFYYPSKFGPVHPGLSFDLLAAQVEACRKRKIAVYAYYCTAWDNYLAENRPEWLAVKGDRTNYLPKFDQTPGWTALCIAHPGFVQLMVEHTKEFVSRYAIDGAWFDMPFPINGECYCPECLRQLRSRGLDPMNTRVQREHKQQLEIAFLETLQKTVKAARAGCQVDFNNQAACGLGGRVHTMDNIDLEALPSAAGWGYYYFPLVVRYARTFGVTTYGMTGRFKASWADFGGLKLPAQLDVELAAIVAQGARCDIGDQMPPDGRLDEAVYHVIGKCYAKIKALEPWLEGAVPVTEAAVLLSELPMEAPNTNPNLGLTKLLTECRVQFDIVEPDAAWERYSLVILPDDFRATRETAARLHAYIGKGGAVIACHEAGLIAGTRESWLERYGFEYAGASPFKPAYMAPRESLTGDIPAYEYALYEGASQWRAQGAAKVIAQLGEPAFQRSPEHFTSHAQSPFDHLTDYAAVARSGKVALFGFPLGRSYFQQGYWVYRAALQHVLKSLLAPVVSTNAPVSTEMAVMHQAATPVRRERYLVHAVNWSANRGTPHHPVFHEEPAALTGVVVTLNLPLSCKTVRAAVSGATLAVTPGPAGLQVTVPRIPVHEILVFEV